jgi:hypothetical protein
MESIDLPATELTGLDARSAKLMLHFLVEDDTRSTR